MKIPEEYKHLISNHMEIRIPLGWKWIVLEYLKRTDFDVKLNGLDIKIHQIKGTRGCLRFRITANKPDLDAANAAYCEALADYTCERCGTMTRNKKYTNGHVVGLCEGCYSD